MAKRYLLFIGDDPANGGWGDFSQDFADIGDAVTAGEAANEQCGTWWHVVDLETMTTVANGERYQ